MNLFSTKFYIFKKTKPFIVALIVTSFIHNFIVFPVQAAMDESGTNYIKGEDIFVIKKPNSQIKRLEQISAAEKENKIDFTLVATEKAQAVPAPTPIAIESKTGRRVSLTAYNSEAAQTDSDPCTTANGFNVCKHGVEDTVAANFLPMGTKIKIPSLFGDKVFVVRDRMARRHTNRVDVWMLKKSDALKFGVRHAEIVVLD